MEANSPNQVECDKPPAYLGERQPRVADSVAHHAECGFLDSPHRCETL